MGPCRSLLLNGKLVVSGLSGALVSAEGIQYGRKVLVCYNLTNVNKLSAGLAFVGWTWRRARCTESLLWLLVGPLLNSTGGNCMLCTSSRSHAVHMLGK